MNWANLSRRADEDVQKMKQRELKSFIDQSGTPGVTSGARDVDVDVRDQIAYVTLDRADKLNGLDVDMFHAVARTARSLRRHRDIRCVILQGRGRAFCAGLDFASVERERSRIARAFLRRPGRTTNLFQQAALGWRELPMPVLAVTHGYCFGAGFQLALAADFRFTTPDCQFSIMEAKWGLVPDMAATVTLPELIPLDVAMRLTMTAAVFDGVQAGDLGLVTEVTSDPVLAAEALAAQLVSRSPDAVAAAKSLLRRGWHAPPATALRIERRIQRQLLGGANHKIARNANLGDQPPWFGPRRFVG